MTRGIIASLFGALALAGSSQGVLNEFSVADGYQSPFSTRVWTYNPLWTFDGGAIGSNYVAQHGYGSGFAFTEPYALVIRNDVPGTNYDFSYAFEAADLGGVSPGSVAGQRIKIGFDVNPAFGTNSGSGAPMFTMAFGGTRTSPGMRLGFNSENRMVYSNGSNVLQEYTGFQPSPGLWSRVELSLDFATHTYDLGISSMTGSFLNASNTWTPNNTYTIATGMPFANSINTLDNLWFSALSDSATGSGFGKSFLDHFTSGTVPTPGASALLLGAGLLAGRRRR